MMRLAVLILLVMGNLAAASLASAETSPKDAPTSAVVKASPQPLPRLVDLGAERCVPCRMMAPILKEMTADFEGQLEVVFIDVWKKPEAGRMYGIRAIPTQIFYDAKGKEIARHEGFIDRKGILDTFQKHGLEFQPKPKPATKPAGDANTQ